MTVLKRIMNHYGGPRRRGAAQETLGLMLFEKQLQTSERSVGRGHLTTPGAGCTTMQIENA